ncbi:MAG: antibiotic biosynthesis monooxygenase family protein [Allosphingosinicella sp.]
MIMFVRVWLYSVEETNRAGFEQAYGPDGDWARLFARSQYYLGTELLRGEPGRYVTIDRWRGEADWRLFMDRFGDDYRALDRECEGLTAEESEIGDFTRVV